MKHSWAVCAPRHVDTVTWETGVWSLRMKERTLLFLSGGNFTNETLIPRTMPSVNTVSAYLQTSSQQPPDSLPLHIHGIFARGLFTLV